MNVMTLIAWMGFKSLQIPYERIERTQGNSGWNMTKKVKLAIDSIISYSMFPIRLMAFVGAFVALIGIAYVPVIIFNAYFGSPAPGWTELMVVVLIIGGLQMLMISILGEYLWRTFCESRNRPRYIIEDATNNSEGIYHAD